MLESANGTMERLGEFLAWRQALWGMTCKARAKGGCPLDEDLREEMLLGREVVVQRAESNIGFLGHVLDLDALVLVAFQQHEARIDDALTACQLIFGQQGRRDRVG